MVNSLTFIFKIHILATEFSIDLEENQSRSPSLRMYLTLLMPLLSAWARVDSTTFACQDEVESEGMPFPFAHFPRPPTAPAWRCILFMWHIWNYFWWPLPFLSPGTRHSFSQSAPEPLYILNRNPTVTHQQCLWLFLSLPQKKSYAVSVCTEIWHWLHLKYYICLSYKVESFPVPSTMPTTG